MLKRNLDPKSFFYAGGLVEYPLSPKVALQGELLYTQIGGKMSKEAVPIPDSRVINFENTRYNLRFSQIQVPVSIKYSIIPQFSASVGMNIAFNLSSKVKTTFLGTDLYDYEGIKTLNLYPFLGAEYKFNKKFFVDAQYNFNFTKINTANGLPVKAGFLQTV
ncbi:porin family protein [Chryseobacterium paludis]|uniref:porin family protein n=1 Tax=Chryseobacterium paludis TaxID=2956784 RepID=UPI0021BE175C|nr:porin family protein [Chryseobacterium paludis]